MPVGTVLHILSQRPSLTGSGVTLDALVEQAAGAGWSQHVVVGVPASTPSPGVASLRPERVDPVRFGAPPLDFPVPGMSDVMPYPSTRFSAMTEDQLQRYRAVWASHLSRLVESVRPNVIHAHHIWIVGALLKDLAPEIPVVSHCHATGLRQLELCPHLAPEVRTGCARNDRFAVLHAGHAEALSTALSVSPERIEIVGAGYRSDLFRTGPEEARRERIVYAGKYSRAKGLPWLLEAFERVRGRRPACELHIAGSGAGPEAEMIERRLGEIDGVVVHGMLDQPRLAGLLRSARLFVLPSFYEGVPLVLVEAAACGCRIVATALPGVIAELAPHLSPHLTTIALPRLEAVDQPVSEDLPAFVDHLEAAILSGLAADPALPDSGTASLEDRFSWNAVFRRIDKIWRQLVS